MASRGSKNIYRQTQGTTEQIMMLCCASEAGHPHLPMIIFAKSFRVGPYCFDDAQYAMGGLTRSCFYLGSSMKIF